MANILQQALQTLQNVFDPKILSPVSNVQAAEPTPKPTRIPSTTPTPTPTVMKQALEQMGASGRDPRVSNFKITPDVNKAIQGAAETYKMDPSLLYDIAAQESSFNPSLVNNSPEGIKAGHPTGLYQFTDNTWKTLLDSYNNKPGMTLSLPNENRADPTTNAMAAAYLIKHGQLGRWDASRNVWGKYYKDEELKPYYSQTLNRK